MSKGVFWSYIGIALCLNGCATKPIPQPDPSVLPKMQQDFAKGILSIEKPARPLTPAEQKIIGDAVGSILKDPFSAHFNFVPDKGLYFVCGQVNSKNAYGGYVGFKRFYIRVTRDPGDTIVAASQPVLTDEDINDPSIEKSVTAKIDNDACNIAGY